MRKWTNSLLGILVSAGIASGQLHGKDAKEEDQGNLKLNLVKFEAKKSHSIRIKLDWGNGIPLGDNTTVNRVKGVGKDALGRFTYVATRIANPEWTDYTLWLNYDSGRKKNESLRLHWVTHGHEPPDVSVVSDGVWTFQKRMGKLSGTSD